LIQEEAAIYVVADGMGAHRAGEVASQLLVDEVAQQASSVHRNLRGQAMGRDERRRHVIHYLPQLIEQANRRIYLEAQQDPTKRGMGTTAVLFFPVEEDAFVCHVGDSRLYLFRDDQLFQVTEDHSLVMRLYKRGQITREEMANHPRRNIILRSVGIRPEVDVDALYLDMLPGDVFLLCSDGLSDMLDDSEIADLVAHSRGQDLVRRAIAAANAAGGHDNVTALVIEVEGQDEDSVPRFGMLEKVEFLQDIFMFASLSEQECVKVNQILFEQQHTAGDSVIRKGDEGDELYIVVEGSVGIWDGEIFLTEIGPGGHFGEFGLLKDEPRSADVYAETDCRLLLIRRSDFLALIRRHEALGNKLLYAFLQHLADRVRDLSARLSGGGS